MAARLQEKKDELLGKVALRMHRMMPPAQASQAEIFLQHYYRAVAPSDLVDRDALDLYGAALAHLRFGEQRRVGEARIRVYNPHIEQHGWQSTHSVVEIVNDDMPFLVDSVSMALHRLGLVIHLTIHPIVPIRRDAEGEIEAIAATPANGAERAESFMHVEIDRQSDPERLEQIRSALEVALADVRAAVEDWQTMLGRIQDALADLDRASKVDPDELAEARAFLEWIADNNFTFLGYGCYELVKDKEGDQLRRVPNAALGLLRRQALASTSPNSTSFASLPPAVRRLARQPVPLVITKSNTRSSVHRSVYLDYVGVKRYDAQGKVIGEHRFLGLFTSAAYNRNPRSIPLLRKKVARLVERAGFAANSHAGKALQNILDTYPRDELFQTPDDDLFDIVQEILHLQERQRIRLFLRPDAFARFVSCLVYVPRDRYNTELRSRFQRILEDALGGAETEFQAQVSDATLARIQFIVRTPRGMPENIDEAELEARLVDAARSWKDGLRAALVDSRGEEEGIRLYRAYGDAFPVAYCEQIPARAAVPDIDRIDRLAKGEIDLAMSLYRPLERDSDMLRFKIGRAGAGIPLSDALPVLEHMGLRVLDERPYEIAAGGGNSFWFHDFGVRPIEAIEVDLEAVEHDFQDSFERVWRGEVENDGFNQLILHAGLTWRQVLVLRAYCKYLLQIGIPFSQNYMEQTLARNAPLARLLAELFEQRFDPALAAEREAKVAALDKAFLAGLDGVSNLDQDRILRRYRRLILGTVRTNHYQTDAAGRPQPYLSFKIDPAEIPEFPLPRPLCEIFVYSPRMEGVHLRGGRVARGGIRWSDRREDFRTEVLGLMKAQMVKNAVIVPVGAKGGFVVKQPPRGGDRAALQAEVIACYRTLITALLDLTDNRVGEAIQPPAQVVRYDQDDPYLVVAADKGTATFSDIANEISVAHGHWLGDAFASGGSAGYDHKGMGITARGAWESVKRHFLELGKDCQAEPFTVVGIGDMSGDVFGNGMLLSPQIRLLAAFDHRHIFIDPDPDPAVSFAERQRLFALARSSWDDYDRARLSAGGAIIARTTKSITLSPEARQALAIEAETLTPQELMRGILLAPVELFWNGGIGTYVKAASERHADAADRANDAVRVDGRELRCKIVGEGGNLGLTQRGRIEFAQGGGRINTDFIDNSAGVDCSDHEVNIKILLGAVVAAGDMTGKQRDQLLARMTEEVAELVLRNNILQVQAISLAEAHPQEWLDSQAAMMRRLETAGRLNRELELLPDEEALANRRQQGLGLYRPELAVLLAYAKMTLYDQLLASDLPDDPYLVQDLVKYFPRPLRKRFLSQIEGHRLRREITATLVANSIVNRGLGEFVGELAEQTGWSTATIARGYIVARDAFGLVPLIGQLEQLASRIGAPRQVMLLGEARLALAQGTQWFLRNLPAPIDAGAAVGRFATGIQRLIDALDQMLAAAERAQVEQAIARYVEAGIAPEMARRFASLPYLCPASEAAAAASSAGVDVLDAGKIYFALDASLQLGELRQLLRRAGARNRWDRLAIEGLHEDLVEEHRRLTLQALADAGLRAGLAAPIEAVTAAVADWLRSRVAGLGRWRRLLAEIESQQSPDLAMLAVAVRTLGGLNAGDAVAA